MLQQMPRINIEASTNSINGDYSCDAPLLIARQLSQPAGETAAAIAKHIMIGQNIERVETADTGYLHLFLRTEWLGQVVREARQQGALYGRSDGGQGRSVQVEFVSADPNRPLDAGRGRAAALGDVLARLLEWTGWRVTREYYINDAANSTQLLHFGRSLYTRYQQVLGRDVPLPEDGYEEEYVIEIARAIADREGDRYLSLSEAEGAQVFSRLAFQEMLTQHREDLKQLGVAYDVWFSEQSLYETGAVAETLELLRSSGYAYEAEGALWLRSTAFGDDRDRVLVRATGAPTYLAADTAYHRNKFARGFDRIIDVWGPEYNAYTARTHAAVTALGLNPDRLEILIYQLVRLSKGGEPVRTSKRAGDTIPLSDVIEEVGPDAARFSFLKCPADVLLDFDIDLAKCQELENPVYAIRYAHARAAGTLRDAAAAGLSVPSTDALFLPSNDDFDRNPIRKIAEFPEAVAAAAESCQPHRIAIYARELGASINGYLDANPVPGGGIAPDAETARLALVDAARVALANALQLLGITAPERM